MHELDEEVRGELIARDLRVDPGSALPLGASRRDDGVNFAVHAADARAVTLQLWFGSDVSPAVRVALDPARGFRTGTVWHARVGGLPRGVRYDYSVTREDGMHWPHLLDPLATQVDGHGHFGPIDTAVIRTGSVDVLPFDWGEDVHPRTPWRDTVIYELPLRAFTRHSSSGTHAPGTFEGLREKIPYLVDLGVTAVELLPIFEFEEDEGERRNPDTGERLLNVWGYQPLSFMAPRTGLSMAGDAAGASHELKRLVHALHRAGIEVMLDVVYNHTGEGGADGRTVSWRGLAESQTYLTDPDTGAYLDFTGCGNTLNANHPVTTDLILASMRHWVCEYHIDGFRLDLASALCRGAGGTVLDEPPLIERMAMDPVLADTRLIAEPWDAHGLYQVGTFPGGRRFAQWNDRFRDDVRRFMRGDGGFSSALAARLAGSDDLFAPTVSEPWQSINFVTAHDGFTLRDLVSYTHKHNRANGEDGRDGNDSNHSYNCGVEGPSDDPEVMARRQRQSRNLLACLLLASGTPMLLAGDEVGRTQHGNNNAYCQDNETVWFDWTLLEREAGLHRFVRELVALRKRFPELRRHSRADGDEPVMRWHGVCLDAPDWAEHSHTLALETRAGRLASYLVVNAWHSPLDFELPQAPGGRWLRVLDTACPSPADIVSTSEALVMRGSTTRVEAGSVVLALADARSPS